MKHRASFLLKNSVILLFGRVSEFLFGFISLILIARYLGAEQFGDYAFVRGIGIVLTPIIAIGSTLVLLRELSVKKEQMHVMLSSAMIMQTFSCIMLLLISAAVFSFLPATSSEIHICTYLVIISQTLFVMQKTFMTVFLARERVIYDSAVSIFSRFVALLLFVFVWRMDLGMIALFCVPVAAFLTGTLTGCYLVGRHYFVPKPILSFQTMGFLLRESWTLSLSNIIAQGYMNVGLFLLKAYSGRAQISFFQIPRRFIEPLNMLPRAVMPAFQPTLSHLGRDEETREDLTSTYGRILKYMLIFSLPVCVFVMIYAAPVISLSVGREFSGAVIPFQITIWTIVFMSVNILNVHLLTALTKQWIIAISNGCALAFCFLASLWLIPAYGAIGASVAFTCGSFVMFAMNYYFASKHLGRVGFVSTAIRPVIASAVMYIVLNSTSNLPIAVQAVSVLFGLVVYFGLLVILKTIAAEEIELIRHLVKRIANKVGLLKSVHTDDR